MDWMKIGSAILMLVMVFMIWPRAKHMMTNSPKGTRSDWTSALLPLALVIVFIFLLIALVQ